MDQALNTSAAPFLDVDHAEARASMTRRDNGEIIVEAGYPLRIMAHRKRDAVDDLIGRGAPKI